MTSLTCHFERMLDPAGLTFLPKWLQLGCPDLQNIAFRVGVVSIYENAAFLHKVAEDLAKSANKACQVTAEPAK